MEDLHSGTWSTFRFSAVGKLKLEEREKILGDMGKHGYSLLEWNLTLDTEKVERCIMYYCLVVSLILLYST